MRVRVLVLVLLRVLVRVLVLVDVCDGTHSFQSGSACRLVLVRLVLLVDDGPAGLLDVLIVRVLVLDEVADLDEAV